MAEETVVLHLEVDQGAAERQLERIEGVLLDNKKAVQDLQAAYKKGNVTQGEYVKENIRLQQNIKKEQDLKKTLIKTIETESNSRNSLKNRISTLVKEYDNLNLAEATGIKRADALEKELAQLNAQLTKGDKSAGLFKNQIGNYPKVLGDAAQNIRVAGVSLGDFTTKVASLANPITAAVGLLGALGSAYANSTLGAKDLEFAQTQLSFSLKLASNSLGEFLQLSEDGPGIISEFANAVITRFGGVGAGVKVRVFAGLQEELQDLGRLEEEIRINANQRVEENQELLERIADEQVNINSKIQAAADIEENLTINKRNILDVLNSQLRNVERQLALDKDNEEILDLVLAKRRQISQESSSLEKQLTRINKQQDDLNAKVAEQVRLTQQLFEFDVREANAPPISLTPETFDFAGGVDDPAIAASKARTDQFLQEVKIVGETEAQKREAYQKTIEIQNALDSQRFNAMQDVAQAGAAIFGEQTAAYKAFASASTIISTYSAATKAYESAFLPIPTVASPALGAISAGAAIALGLANLAKINGVEFAEGGYTGDGGKYEPKGVVHGGEFVIPKESVSQYGKSHFKQYLPQYADGGFVANQSTAPINQALIIGNMMKNLPQPVLAVKEVTTVQNRIAVRENVSTLHR